MKNVHVFVLIFLCAVTMLIFRWKELFQMKNGVTTSLLFFVLKMPNIWVGRMTVNGERKRGWPNLVLCLTKFVDTLLQPISKSQKSYLSLERQMWKTQHSLFRWTLWDESWHKYTAKWGYIEIVGHIAYENFYTDNPFLHMTCRKCLD